MKIIMKNNSTITRVAIPSLAIVALALFGSSAAWAQSGGNTVSTVDNTVCSINSSTGVFGNPMFTQLEGGSFQATIKLPNASPGLLVRPSLVTGMYTNTLSSNTTNTQTAAIVVVVTDDQTGYPTVTLTPNQACVVTNTHGTQCGVAYDERFQQLITTNLTNNASVDLILST